jgi:hypothetical protein
MFSPFLRSFNVQQSLSSRVHQDTVEPPGLFKAPKHCTSSQAVELFAKRTELSCLRHASSFQPESCDSWSTLILHHPNNAPKKDVTAKSTARAAQEKPDGLQVGGTRSQIFWRKKRPGQTNNNSADHEERETKARSIRKLLFDPLEEPEETYE